MNGSQLSVVICSHWNVFIQIYTPYTDYFYLNLRIIVYLYIYSVLVFH